MMDSRRLHHQRPPAHNYDARPQQQGLDPYLSAQNRAPQYQDQIPSRRDVYGAGFRSVGDQPPSPIAFAVREPYPNASTNDVSYIAPNAPPQRERANTPSHSRQHAFLDEPPPAGFPAKNHPGDSGAKSTFSADDDHSVSNRSRTSSGGKKILKRMMKELAGGPKEPAPPLDGNPLSPKKEKVLAYGRGGAGRVKKKPSATLAEKSKSSASIASSDDMKTLKSASSSAAKKTGKVVYDPYLKTMVGTRGITVPPAAGPTVTTTIPPPPSSANSSTPQTPDSYAYSSSKFTSISGSSRTDPSLVGSIARPPSSRSGWDEESIISDAWASGRSRDHYTSPPPSAFTYSSSRTDPQGYPSPPPSEGRVPSAWKSHHGIQRRPSDLSLRAGTGAPPILDPTQLLIHSLLQQQQPAASVVPLPVPPTQPTSTPDLATTLYAALLAQQTGIPPPAPSIQQPIIPPQLASNLDSIIAAATAYSQLLAAATGAGVGPVAPTQPDLPTPPVTIPNNPPGKGKDDVGALNAALASYTLSTPSTAASSPSSISALSPPPRHKQLRKGTPTGSHGPTPPRRSSSPHTAPEESKQLPVDDSAWSRRKGQFQNLVTPPATDDGQTNTSSSLTVNGNPGSLASNVSFSSSLTPSPAPSTLTFAQPPPPELVRSVKSDRAPDRRPSRDEPLYRSAPVPALTPSASSSSLSQSSAFLDAPVSTAGRNRSNTTSQESFSSTRSNISDKDQVSKAEKELLKLEKSLQSFRTLSSENMQKQYSAGRAPSRAAEAPRDTPIASADRTRVLPPAKQPPPSSAGAALSVNANTPRRPRRTSVTETDEEYYRRMHMALPPLPSAPSPVSHVNRSRKDSSTTSTTTTTSSSSQSLPRGHAAPAPNFSTRPTQLELENPLSSYGRHAMPTRGGPSAEALASRQPSTWKSNGVDPSARLSVQSPTLTEMDFPMPPSSITVRPGAGGPVRPGPRKESLLTSSTARPRRDYI